MKGDFRVSIRRRAVLSLKCVQHSTGEPTMLKTNDISSGRQSSYLSLCLSREEMCRKKSFWSFHPQNSARPSHRTHTHVNFWGNIFISSSQFWSGSIDDWQVLDEKNESGHHTPGRETLIPEICAFIASIPTLGHFFPDHPVAISILEFLPHFALDVCDVCSKIGCFHNPHTQYYSM